MAPLVAEHKVPDQPSNAGLMSFPGITPETTRTVSELLQRNENDHHGFWSHRGFHNHTVELLLASYDFGATSTTLHGAYNRAKETQRPRPAIDEKVLIDLSDESTWHKYLGNNDYYLDFLTFFQNEMAEIGVEQILNKRFFGGTEMADDLLVRSFGGISHSLIRIGYGLEFGLPGLIPQGLAIAAGASNWPAEYFVLSEKGAAVEKEPSATSVRALLEQIRNDKVIRESSTIEEPLLYLPILASAKDEIVSYAKQYRVPVNQIEEKTAELANICAFMLGGAMRKDKEVRTDFFLIHSVTPSILFATFNSQEWIAPQAKARLLEWKARYDLLSYAAIGAPELYKDEIQNYVPKVSQEGAGNLWLGIIDRALRVGDDGHTVKTIRSLVHGERICAKYKDLPEADWPVVGEMWKNIAAMSIDSSEGYGDCLGGFHAWVRGAGIDEAWEHFGPRKVALE